MRTLTIVLTTTLLKGGLAHSEEPLQLRYQAGFGPMIQGELAVRQRTEVELAPAA